MPFLRIIKTTKKVGHTEYVSDVFSIDPDPKTRGRVVPVDVELTIPSDASTGVRYVKAHLLTHLPGGPGRFNYSDQAAANLALFQYAVEFYQLADSGNILFRYNKENDEGTLVTYVVFTEKQYWLDMIKTPYDSLKTHLSELFDITEVEKEISDNEYSVLVSTIQNDISNMKNLNVGKCRLDFMNQRTL
jgi:hypothetical protein